MTTGTKDSIKLLDQLERELDEVVADYLRWTATHASADADATAPVDAIVQRIQETLPFETLGDLRLHAKALRRTHAGSDDRASLDRLLIALESLPERLWNEKINR